MPQQLPTESLDETKQRIARRKLPVAPPRFLQGGSHSSILELQRTLGNQRVAQLIHAKRLTLDGRIIGLQRQGENDGEPEEKEESSGFAIQPQFITETNSASLQRQSESEEDEPEGAGSQGSLQRTCAPCEAAKDKQS